MSTQPTTKSYDCAECGDEIDVGYNGSFCSEDCYYRHKGEKAQNLLKHDHRICGSCGRQLKEVNPPTEDWKHAKGVAYQVALENGGTLSKEAGKQVLDLTNVRDVRPIAVDSVIGFQFRTPNAINVEKEIEGAHKHSRMVKTGIGCVCGNTDPSADIEELQVTELATILSNYVKIYKELYQEGQLDQRIDKDMFFQSFKASGGDLQLALGRGLYER